MSTYSTSQITAIYRTSILTTWLIISKANITGLQGCKGKFLQTKFGVVRISHYISFTYPITERVYVITSINSFLMQQHTLITVGAILMVMERRQKVIPHKFQTQIARTVTLKKLRRFEKLKCFVFPIVMRKFINWVCCITGCVHPKKWFC